MSAYRVPTEIAAALVSFSSKARVRMDAYRLKPEATLHIRGDRWCAEFEIAGTSDSFIAQLTVRPT